MRRIVSFETPSGVPESAPHATQGCFMAACTAACDATVQCLNADSAVVLQSIPHRDSADAASKDAGGIRMQQSRILARPQTDKRPKQPQTPLSTCWGRPAQAGISRSQLLITRLRT